MNQESSDDHQKQLDSLFGDDDLREATPDREEDWAALAAQHEQLKAAFKDMDTPSEETFATMRQRVLGDIKPYAKVVSFPTRLLQFAAMAAAVLVAFYLGNTWQQPGMPISMLEEPTDSLVQRVRHNAAMGDHLEDAKQRPYRYANISFEPRGEAVQLSFDVVRSVAMQVDRSDPLVSELLVHSLLSPSPVASRLRAVKMAGTQLEPKVRTALVFTMLQDENFAVRERAMHRLAPYISDETVQDAFLKLLKSDDNVQLRLLALDVLSKYPGAEPSLQNITDQLNQPNDLPLLMELEQR